MEYLLLALYWAVIEQELLFQEFMMLQDVAMNESQKGAGDQICTRGSLQGGDARGGGRAGLTG